MVSVVVPIYNAESTIDKMIASIQNQTYLSFEVILVDDGSSDSSGIICDHICRKDARFKVIHQENEGVSSARNNGIRAAKGSFLTFLDADDEIPENYLQVLIEEQKKTNADVVICDVVIIESGRETMRFTHVDKILDQCEALNLLLTRRSINSGPCAKLFRATVVNEAVFPNLKAYEDIVFVKDVFDNAQVIAVTNKTEYRYIQNENSAMHQYTKMPSTDIIVASENLLHFIKTRQDLKPECFYITMSHLYQYVVLIQNVHSNEANRFTQNVRCLYKCYYFEILRNSAFTWKEKVLFTAFCLGIDKILVGG